MWGGIFELLLLREFSYAEPQLDQGRGILGPRVRVRVRNHTDLSRAPFTLSRECALGYAK